MVVARVVAALLLVGCGSGGDADADAGTDRRDAADPVFDAGARDGGGPRDAGDVDDAGVSDADPGEDGGGVDATSGLDGGSDAGGTDSGSPDSGGPDGGAMFACGPTARCDRLTEYCSVFYAGPAGVPPSFNCLALPSSCTPPPTCACLPSGVGCSCMEVAGAITYSCFAP